MLSHTVVTLFERAKVLPNLMVTWHIALVNIILSGLELGSFVVSIRSMPLL